MLRPEDRQPVVPGWPVPHSDEELGLQIVRLHKTDPSLATIIPTTYTTAARAKLLEAIDTVCGPVGSYGWSTAGVYVFWDPDTREVLYVGLALNLLQRFQQHNGVAPCPAAGCKRDKVLAYLANNRPLGYSLILQTRNRKPVCQGVQTITEADMEWFEEQLCVFSVEEAKELLNKEIDVTIRRTEGAMLAAFKADNGRLPAWNSIGGIDSYYPPFELDDARDYLKAVTSQPSRFDPLIVKASIVDIADNPSWEGYEEYLHGVRLFCRKGFRWEDAWKMAENPETDPLKRRSRMVEQGYLDRKLIL